MKKNLILIIISIIFINCLFYACRKDNAASLDLSNPERPLTVDMANKYYDQLIDKEGDVAISPVNSLLTTESLNHGKVTNHKYIMKSKGYASKTKDASLVEYPLFYNKRPTYLVGMDMADLTPQIRDQILAASFNHLMIYKNKTTGEIDERILTYIPDKYYLARHNNDMSGNKAVSNLDNDFSGSIVYSKWDGTPLYYLKVRYGVKISTNFIHLANSNKGTTNSKLKVNDYNDPSGCSSQEMGYFERTCYSSDPEAGPDFCTGWELQYSWTEYSGDCSFNNTGSNNNTSGGGGGGNTSTTPAPPDPPKPVVTDSLDNYPCAQSVLQSIPNLKDEIADIINATFGRTTGINLIYRPLNLPANTSGQIDQNLTSTYVNNMDPQTHGYSNITINFVIDLNTDILQNATKEYILTTMYHEALHAYLDYYYLKLGPEAFHTQYPSVTSIAIPDGNGGSITRLVLDSHGTMAATFLTPLTLAIQHMNPNFTDLYALQMAEEGMVNDPTIGNTTTAERTGSIDALGTKCPK